MSKNNILKVKMTMSKLNFNKKIYITCMYNIIITIFELFSTTIFLITFFFHDFFNTKSKLIITPFLCAKY